MVGGDNMKQFRVILVDYNLCSQWFNEADWTIEDLMHFLEFGNVDYEYRRI